MTSVVRNRQGVLKQDNLVPGQQIAMDHFICSTKGRLFTSRGKTADSEMFSGGCLFVDHASGYIHVEFQTSLNTHETINAKDNFELMCRDHGVVPQSYLTDNGSAFTSAGFTAKLCDFAQIIRFAGTGAHHHNGTAERAIQTIMSMARTMMLHAAIHWPDVSNPSLWPMAVHHAIQLFNRMPSIENGICPANIFTKTCWEQCKFHDFHVWGCPVFILDKQIADGKKLPHWKPRSKRAIYMGASPVHASSVPLVLNPNSGAIISAFHVVFDDWFATVPLPDDYAFPDEEWQRLFGDSEYQFMFDDDDDSPFSLQSDLDAFTRHDLVGDRIAQVAPATPLPIPPPPTAPLLPDTPVNDDLPVLPLTVTQVSPAKSFASSPQSGRPYNVLSSPFNPVTYPNSFPSPMAPPIPSPNFSSPRPALISPVCHPREPPMSSPREPSVTSPFHSSPSGATTIPSPLVIPRRETSSETTPVIKKHQATTLKPPQPNTSKGIMTHSGKVLSGAHRVTRSSTSSLPPRVPRYGYDGSQGHGYVTVPSDADPPTHLLQNHPYQDIAAFLQAPPVYFLPRFEGCYTSTMYYDSGLPTPAAYKAAITDPDILMYEQAMNDKDHVNKWLHAMQIKISQLESLNCWEEVDINSAKSKIIPGTWVFKVKRSPDGEIKKYKARYCCRGDLQDDKFETFAPIVSWTSVHLFLVLTTVLNWTTCSCNFTNAFVQATLPEPIWIHLPRGFRSQRPTKTCLKLNKSQYGLTIAPQLWYQHLLSALKDMGFSQSTHNPCLLYKKNFLVIVYVDDVGIAASHANAIDSFVDELKSHSFGLTKEGSFSEYLGIKFEKNANDGTITLTQKGLIKKILTATGLTDSNLNHHPAAAYYPHKRAYEKSGCREV